MSACSASRCELTDVYSPMAIDSAPATSAATPASTTVWCEALGRGDGDHQAGHRDDAVVGPEHGGAQPPAAVAEVTFGMQNGRWHPVIKARAPGP